MSYALSGKFHKMCIQCIFFPLHFIIKMTNATRTQYNSALSLKHASMYINL